ncbi:uncharacterized protein B0P05DRAFT_549717 [Gilbertella persicaria]|uniref:DUF423 domain-containing protein n=1 Tax=Rhizopus stolonifer TaxID=4846 RepID=A0A367KJ15_RHIST|nr:uncharacterized protein B0P05DRAFT_549717 [Gilbertella persicaria]KAI8071132.1 hypothetical protein B0P05DRAFT_549717 [Gilbertella persicaria]RCI01842.1 hypothetical protein CU098_008441 [Rhizopus stolonifer]
MTSQFFWRAGSLLGATGLGLGAYGAHGLAKVVGDNPTKIKNWTMAAEFQIVHGVALLALSSIPPSVRRIHPAAQPLILSGTIMFSGTIYLLTLQRDKFRALGPVTPLGGLAMMAGWAALLL